MFLLKPSNKGWFSFLAPFGVSWNFSYIHILSSLDFMYLCYIKFFFKKI